MYDNEMLNGDVIYLILSYLHRFTTKNKKLNYNINKLLHCKKIWTSGQVCLEDICSKREFTL